MDSLYFVLAFCLVLGAFVGFMAGLLGIGGGLIVVPALFYLLPKIGVEPQYVPLIAISTSLANMMLTSASAVIAHQRRGNIDWQTAKVLLPGILLGALSSGSIAALIPANHLQQLFAIFVIFMAINMGRSKQESSQETQLPNLWILLLITGLIAMISGILGIGGGVMLVPMLCFFGFSMTKAVGLSSLAGMCVATAGSIGYIVAGWDVTGLPSGTVGYVYLPALAGIALSSTLTAPIGVKAASSWPTAKLKKIFALFLVIVGLELVFSSFNG